MSVEVDLARVILDTVKGCVADCSVYKRFPIIIGDPAQDCSLIGIGINNFDPLAQVANCSIHGLNLNIVIAQCCVPIGNADGSPPSTEELERVTECLTNDVEAVICCLKSVSFDIPGAIKQCRPTINAIPYNRLGGCISAKINAIFPGVPV